MGWMPGATKRDVGARPGYLSNGRMRSYRGVVLHVNVSQGPAHDSPSGDSLYNWITRPGSNMSCHFQVSQTGGIEQYVDTLYSAWCQQNGNDDWLSIETEGYPQDPLTEAQVQACARIMAYCHAEHGIPLQLTDSPSGTGFGWHGMGGTAWGNHPGCPGEARKAQRTQILAIAAGGEEEDMNPAQEAKLDEVLAISRTARRDGDTAKWPYYFTPAEATLTAVQQLTASQGAQLSALTMAIQQLASAGGVDLAAVQKAAEEGAQKALNQLQLTVSTATPDK